MNTHTFLATVVVLCTMTASLMAGDAHYKIICVTGDVHVRAESSQSWKPAKTNQTLEKDASVKIGTKGGYCCLLSDNGEPIEFREKGTKELSDLTLSKPSSTLSEVSSYLEQSFNASQQKRHYVGSVYRSAENKLSSIVFPYDTRLLDGKIRLVWRKTGANQSYTLVIRDAAKNEVLKRQLADTSYTVDLSAFGNIQRGDCLYWNVYAKASMESQTPYALCWASRQAADSLENENMRFRQQKRGYLDPQKSPIAAMLNGAWFEKRGYFAEALKYYETAEAMVPAAKEFRAAKSTLLARLGM